MSLRCNRAFFLLHSAHSPPLTVWAPQAHLRCNNSLRTGGVAVACWCAVCCRIAIMVSSVVVESLHQVLRCLFMLAPMALLLSSPGVRRSRPSKLALHPSGVIGGTLEQVHHGAARGITHLITQNTSDDRIEMLGQGPRIGAPARNFVR